MLDKSAYTDHRMIAAQSTGCRQAASRGWNFDRAVDESPMWIRALVEISRPRSIILLAVIAGVCAVWWL